jgi:hypothetical protein
MPWRERAMPPFFFLELLPLPQMFVACIACGAVVLLGVMGGAWLTLRVFKISPKQRVLDSDSLTTGLSTIFALLVAFSAAGIWNDNVQARAAVQREANALENVVALASSYPSDLREEVSTEMMRYARRVLDSDWPAMQRPTDLNEELYDRSDNPLVTLMTRISTEAVSGGRRLPLSDILVGQILDIRSARLQREQIARGGVSASQWVAMVAIAIAALIVIMLSQQHDYWTRVRTAAIYVIAVSLSFVIIIAHDTPFAGAIAIKPVPIEQAVKRIQAVHIHQPPEAAEIANTTR